MDAYSGRDWWHARLVCHFDDGMSLVRLEGGFSFAVRMDQEYRIPTEVIPVEFRETGSRFLLGWPKQGRPEKNGDANAATVAVLPDPEVSN